MKKIALIGLVAFSFATANSYIDQCGYSMGMLADYSDKVALKLQYDQNPTFEIGMARSFAVDVIADCGKVKTSDAKVNSAAKACVVRAKRILEISK